MHRGMHTLVLTIGVGAVVVVLYAVIMWLR
jgi:hypothetical protein